MLNATIAIPSNQNAGVFGLSDVVESSIRRHSPIGTMHTAIV